MASLEQFVDGEALPAEKLNALISAINSLSTQIAEEKKVISGADVTVDMTDLSAPTYFECTNSTGITSLAITMKDMPQEVTIRFTVASSVSKLPIEVEGTAYVVGDQSDFEALAGGTYEISIRKSAMAIGELTTFVAS